MSKKFGLFTTAAVAALAIGLMSSPTYAADVIVGLVTKTNTNPFFVKMKRAPRRRRRNSA